ncbi:MAG: CBS domain-containing protein, partial [Verrucomicrobiota bacterium]
AVMKPGDFFGERALVHGGGYHYDAVSPGCTELLSVSGDVILPFFRASRRLGRVLAKTTAQYSATDELRSVEEKLDPAMLGQVVSEVMRTDLACLKPEQTIREALEYFQERRFSTYPLVAADNKLVGVISRETFFDFLKRGDVSNDTQLDRIERMHLPICRDRDTVSKALEMMIRAGRYKCVVTNENNQLLGILTVMDLLGEAASHSLRKA